MSICKCVYFILFHRCFHYAPVVCLQMWEHDWVTPRPKCHAGEKNGRMIEISCHPFLLSQKATSCTSPAKLFLHSDQRQKGRGQLKRTNCSCLNRRESLVFFLSPACMSLRVLHTYTHGGVVLLCHLATHLATILLLQ